MLGGAVAAVLAPRPLLALGVASPVPKSEFFGQNLDDQNFADFMRMALLFDALKQPETQKYLHEHGYSVNYEALAKCINKKFPGLAI